jgi:hypothetical protein
MLEGLDYNRKKKSLSQVLLIFAYTRTFQSYDILTSTM